MARRRHLQLYDHVTPLELKGLDDVTIIINIWQLGKLSEVYGANNNVFCEIELFLSFC